MGFSEGIGFFIGMMPGCFFHVGKMLNIFFILLDGVINFYIH